MQKWLTFDSIGRVLNVGPFVHWQTAAGVDWRRWAYSWVAPSCLCPPSWVPADLAKAGTNRRRRSTSRRHCRCSCSGYGGWTVAGWSLKGSRRDRNWFGWCSRRSEVLNVGDRCKCISRNQPEMARSRSLHRSRRHLYNRRPSYSMTSFDKENTKINTRSRLDSNRCILDVIFSLYFPSMAPNLEFHYFTNYTLLICNWLFKKYNMGSTNTRHELNLNSDRMLRNKSNFFSKNLHFTFSVRFLS